MEKGEPAHFGYCLIQEGGDCFVRSPQHPLSDAAVKKLHKRRTVGTGVVLFGPAENESTSRGSFGDARARQKLSYI